MSAPRWLAPGAAVAALVGIVAIGSSVPAPPSAATLPEATQELLTGAAQVCPSSLEAVEASADVSAWALPERAAGPVEDQPGSSLAVVPLRGPDDPAPESAATTERADDHRAPDWTRRHWDPFVAVGLGWVSRAGPGRSTYGRRPAIGGPDLAQCHVESRIELVAQSVETGVGDDTNHLIGRRSIRFLPFARSDSGRRRGSVRRLR